MKKLLSFLFIMMTSLYGMAQTYPVDYTSWITCPNFTSATETETESESNEADTKWIIGGTYVGGWQYKSFKAGHTCWNADLWTSSTAALDVHQDINNLPVGYYTITCLATTKNLSSGTQKAYVKSDMGIAYAPALTTATSLSSITDWSTLTTDKILVTDGNLRIGFCSSKQSTTSGSDGNFWCTHFQLSYVAPATDADKDALLTGLKNLIAKCNTIKSTSYPGLTDFNNAITSAQGVVDNSASTATNYSTALTTLSSSLKTYNYSGNTSVPSDVTSYSVICPNFNSASSLSEGTSSNGIASNWVNGSTSSGGNCNFQACYPNRNGTTYSGWERNCWDMTTTNKDNYNDIHQDITGIPNGYYSVSCLATLEKSGTTLLVNQISDQHVYAVSANGTAISPIYYSGTTPEWITQATDRVKVTDGKLTIGYRGSAKMLDGSYSTAGKAGHFFITGFQLKYYGTDANNAPAFDEGATCTTTPATNVQVKMTRALKGGKWNTICLPYAMTNEHLIRTFGADVKVAAFTSVDGTKLKFTKVTATEANTPYLIMTSVELSAFTVDNANVVDVSTINSVAQGNFTFTGTYSNGNVPTDAYYINDNAFYKSDGSATIKSFRGYFKSASNAKEMSISVDGETTGITSVNANAVSTKANVYNLNGQLMKANASSLNGLNKGIYIQNGKKVEVK